jgi:hypothetical protein
MDLHMDISADYHSIKFEELGDLTIAVHKGFYAELMDPKWKLTENAIYEILLFHKDAICRGWASFSGPRIDEVWNTHHRKLISRFIRNCEWFEQFGKIKYIPGVQSRKYKLAPKKGYKICKGYLQLAARHSAVDAGEAPVIGDFHGDEDSLALEHDSLHDSSSDPGDTFSLGCTTPCHIPLPLWIEDEYRMDVVVPDSWLSLRRQRWMDGVVKNPGWRDMFHSVTSGITTWGSSMIKSIESIAIPNCHKAAVSTVPVSDVGRRKSAKSWFWRAKNAKQKVLKRGISGRCYHILTQCSRLCRPFLKVVYENKLEDIAIVDMSCTYLAIIAGQLKNKAARAEIIGVLQNGDIYTELTEGSGMTRDEAKREFQRQCLFYKTYDEEKRPLWMAFKKRFPVLAHVIQRKHGGKHSHITSFSHFLTNLEASIFLDRVVPELCSSGIPAVPIHDAVMVPRSCAEIAKKAIEQAAFAVLGFVPKVKIS